MDAALQTARDVWEAEAPRFHRDRRIPASLTETS